MIHPLKIDLSKLEMRLVLISTARQLYKKGLLEVKEHPGWPSLPSPPTVIGTSHQLSILAAWIVGTAEAKGVKSKSIQQWYTSLPSYVPHLFPSSVLNRNLITSAANWMAFYKKSPGVQSSRTQVHCWWEHTWSSHGGGQFGSFWQN